jgi:multidrug efflux pump subunit AcrA (membrane-fusion protein)
MLGGLAMLLAACGATGAPAAASLQAPAAPLTTPTPAAPSFRVQRGEVVEALALDGRVAATIDQDVFFTRDGYLATLHIHEGDVVTQGQLLAEMDLGELPDQLARAQADYDNTQRAMQEGQQQRALAIKSAEIAIATASDQLARAQRPSTEFAQRDAAAAIEQARLNLENVRSTRSVAKTQAQAAIRLAANALRDRQSEYSQAVSANGNKPPDQLKPEQRAAQERAQRALENAQADLDRARVAYDAAVQAEINDIALAELDLKSAQSKLDALRAGPDPLEVADAKRAMDNARLSLTSAQASADDPALAKQADEARLSIEELRKKIDTSRISAPIAGIVATISAKTGDALEAYTPVLSVIDPTQLELVVKDIPADKLAKINAGQAVKISFTRLAGKTIDGMVARLPSDQTTAGSGVKADARLRIGFDAAGLELKVGDAARVTMTLQQAANALWLPPQAVRSFDQQWFVSLRDGGQERRVDIKVGIVTPERVQILDGLKEGDVVAGLQR